MKIYSLHILFSRETAFFFIVTKYNSTPVKTLCTTQGRITYFKIGHLNFNNFKLDRNVLFQINIVNLNHLIKKSNF